ncbi:MAG: anhydro-N-acetylmuramic acid kinase [Bacillota bacterium]
MLGDGRGEEREGVRVRGRQLRRVVGLMSGTSADGVDAALVELRGHAESTTLERVVFRRTPYEPELRARIFALMSPETSRVDEICVMNFVLGEVFARAALDVIREAGLGPGDVDLVGSHGQTIYHIPHAETCCGVSTMSTLQIGEPAVIAERTGLATVADFRVRDVAAGGQGAPLVPYADWVLFRDPHKTRVVQNIGGIANLTALPAGCGIDDVFAFDTGPGNMVIDGVVSILTGGALSFDEDGKMASSGKVRESMLAWALSHPFFAKEPPKTTGREEFGLQFAQEMAERARAQGVAGEDLVATATALTAESIVESYKRWVRPRCRIDEVIVSGGGSYNLALLEMLRERLPGVAVVTCEDVGMSSDAKEAIAFAILANDAACGYPTNVPGATGACRRVVLGKIVPGSR